MGKYLLLTFILASISIITFAQTKEEPAISKDSVLTQYYSGKVGFYSPSNGLNNGLILGVDGITEFNKFNFFLSGDIDFYP